MNWLAFWLNAAIFGICVVMLYTVFLSVVRKKACFGMYSVRDDLIFLVASGVLREDGRVFLHYYERVNTLLSAAPDIGIDNILQMVFIKWREGEDFGELLTRADKMAAQLFTDDAFENPEVRRVVGSYYRGVQNMILAHSSILRASYILLWHIAERLRRRIVRMLPGSYRRALQAVEYASHEAEIVQSARA